MRYLFVLLFVAFSCALLRAQHDRSLSPYFIVNVDSGETVPEFPLEHTSAEVEIAGVIADVTVTQVYTNYSGRALEAIYVFPASTNAAVYAMEMQIGRRVIEAHIMEKDGARAVYETAKQEGKTASLLEQQRPNVFTMSVSNVMPGDSVVVRMSYTERLVPVNGVYEFVYPTVVAPRYTGAGAPLPPPDERSGVQPGSIPYTHKGVKPSYNFGMNISVASAIPFEFIRSNTHKVLLSFASANKASVLLDPRETAGGDRDFVLQYRFAGGKIETGLMLYEGKDENFFMLMMEPPKRVPLDSIPPREYIFVMDVSGSMSGYPIETSKQLLRNLVAGLRPSDQFNVIQFAGGGALFASRSVNANAENTDAAIAFIDSVQASGGTELNSAMRTAMNIPAQTGYSRSIVIVTDGLISAEAGVLRSMREELDSANVFAFGIGSSCNRYLIEAMAFCGNGEPTVVLKQSDADSAAAHFRTYISSPVLSDIRIQYEGFDAYDVDPVAVPDLFASRPLIITGKYHGKAKGKITVTGMTGAGSYRKEIAVDSVKPRKQNKAIRLLWARDRIKYLSYLDAPAGNGWYSQSGQDSAVVHQLTALGLQYSLLTNYTSFVAVDKRVRNKSDDSDSAVTQPLPLPQGMDNSAIGMNKQMSEVIILSARGPVMVDASYSSICSIPAMSIIVPERPVFSAGAPVMTQDPQTIGDLDRFYNGSFVLPVMTHYTQPFFTPGASGRMALPLATDMMGTYTLGTYSLYGESMRSPLHTGSLAFTTWAPRGTQVNLSATHYGTQNLHISDDRNITNRWHSLLEIGEQWKGVSTDRNKDGYEDLATGLSASLHHRLTYFTREHKKFLSLNFSNDLFAHGAGLRAGQTSNDLYTTHDQTLGVYIAPRIQLEVGDLQYIDVSASFAAASMDDRFGIDRFHLNTSQATVAGSYSWNKSSFYFRHGVNGWMSFGEERWNTLRLNAAHQSAAAYTSVNCTRGRWELHGALRAELNDVGGAALLPLLRVQHRMDRWLFAVGVNRYRDMPFAAGQLLPLFYSSRELSVASDVGLNQGWDFKATVSYWSESERRWSLRVMYDAVMPEHSVVIDVDSDAGRTSVYGINGGAFFHRGILTAGLDVTSRWRLDAEYVLTVTPFRYGESILQQPLQPLHRGYASLQWNERSGHFDARVQVCYTGEQRIPQSGWSPDYATVNLQAKYKIGSGRFTVFASVLNVLDYRQKEFLMTTNDQFDGWKVWAPITGRTFQAGVNMSLR
jgi:Ca-activated chloride channel family protein